MEKSPHTNPDFSTDKQNDYSHLRPNDIQEGSLNRRDPADRLRPHPEITRRHKVLGENSDLYDRPIISEHIKGDIAYLDSVVAKYKEPLLAPEKLREVEEFIHILGMDTKPVYLLEHDDFVNATNRFSSYRDELGRYINSMDVALLDVDKMRGYRGKEVIDLSNIVHELAHSSSQYDMFYKHANPFNYSLKNRTGAAVERESHKENNLEGLSEFTGGAIEEGFAEYIRLLYLRKVDYYPEKYLNEGEEYKFGMKRDQLGPSLVKEVIEIVEHAEPKHERESYLKQLLGVIKPEEGLVAISQRIHVLKEINDDETNSLWGGPLIGYPLLGEAFDLLMLDDPTLLQSFIKGRKDVQGLREVAQKLNALEPGLYIKLRNLGPSDEDQFEFYKTVVAVLNKKYFPNGQPIEISEEGEQTQNPH
jgi:hypothetical protein